MTEKQPPIDKSPSFRGWDGTVSSSVGYGKSSDRTLAALIAIRDKYPAQTKLLRPSK